MEISGFFLVATLVISILPAGAVLDPVDFKQQNWSKTVDYFDYVRAYAANNNMSRPPDDWHAYIYLTYVNVSGIQVFYAGLSNITINQTALTIPIQTFMMLYKTKDGLRDAVTASSFMMLMAFSEKENTIFGQSPDRNDTLFASLSLGADLSEFFGQATPPALSSMTTITPLTHSEDNLTWTWGMKYTNLTAIWWKMSIDPQNPTRDARPVAITTYEKLSFNYRLVIDPKTGNATLSTDYVIGRMTNLWVFWWLILIPVTVHYNSTGCYKLDRTKLSDETIYDFLQSQGIKMSIVQFQSTVVLDRTAYSKSSGTNVTDSELDISNGTTSTFTNEGERIFDANFATKKEYNLFNYTDDKTEASFTTYNSTVRTTKIAGFARNPIFQVHTPLMKALPLVVAHMHPELYQQAKEHLFDMSYADYFYVISYPTYSGYRIEHDPTYTAYCSLSSYAVSTSPHPWASVIAIAGIFGTTAAIAIIIMTRKR